MNHRRVTKSTVRILEIELVAILAILLLLGMVIGYAVTMAARTNTPSTHQLTPVSFDSGEEDFVL